MSKLGKSTTRGKSGTVVIDDAAWEKLKKKLSKNTYETRVGVIGDAASTNVDISGLTMAGLFAIHEFGAPEANIPERRPLRRTFERNIQELKQTQIRLAKAVIAKSMTLEQAHEILGIWGAAQVKNTITQGAGVPPPNAPSTIERKGSSRPLVWSGRMMNSISHVVKEGKST